MIRCSGRFAPPGGVARDGDEEGNSGDTGSGRRAPC